MKNITAIAILLLIFCPAYGRHTHHLSKLSSSKALLVASQATDGTSGSESEDENGDDSDNEDSDNDSDGDDSDSENGDNDGSDNGETDTDDEDSSDSDGDNENDDDDGSDGQTSTAKAAIRSALRTTALNRSTKPFAKAAAALDTGLNAKETVAQLLAPASSGSAAAAAAEVGANGSSATIASGVASAGSAGNLTATAVPEPTAFLLFAAGALPWTWHRRRN
jgi:hypothetical protein